jgi:hypothetical protein
MNPLLRPLALGLLAALPAAGCITEFDYVDDGSLFDSFERTGGNVAVTNARLDGQVGFVPVGEPANADVYSDGTNFSGTFQVDNTRGMAMVIVDSWDLDLRRLAPGRHTLNNDVYVTLCGDNASSTNFFDVPAEQVEIIVEQPNAENPAEKRVVVIASGPAINQPGNVPVETSFTLH